MPVPRAVKAADKRASKLHEQAYKKDDQPPDDPITAGQVDDDDQGDDTGDYTDGDPRKGRADPAPAPAPAPADEPEAVDFEARAAYWQRRFSTIDGKYNSEVPRLTQQVRELTEQVNGTAKPAAPAAATAEAVKDALTPQELEEWGPDVVNMIQRVAAQAVGQAVGRAVAPLNETINNLKQQLSNVGATVEHTRGDTFINSLRTRIGRFSDFDEVNNDKNFTKWLAARVPGSGGRTRHQLLTEAFTNKDVDEVTEFFQDYVNEKEPATGKPAPQVVSRQRRGSVDPQTLVEPRGSSHDSSTPVRQRRPPTEADWRELYDKRRRGRIPEAEFRKIERQMYSDMHSAVPG